MKYKENRICRLCLKVSSSDCEVIEKDMKELLLFLLLEIDLSISKDPAVCKNCVKSIKNAFGFKSVCFYIEDRIVSYLPLVTNASLDLREICLNECAVKNSSAYECNTCRLCLKHIECSHYASVHDWNMNLTLTKHMISKCIPEINLEATKDPIICASCLKYLEDFYNFLMNCYNVEGRIKEYYEIERKTRKTQIKLSCFLVFMLKGSTMFNETEETEVVVTENKSSVNIKGSALYLKDEVNMEQNDFARCRLVWKEDINDTGTRLVWKEDINDTDILCSSSHI